jgi:hypothetical protein
VAGRIEPTADTGALIIEEVQMLDDLHDAASRRLPGARSSVAIAYCRVAATLPRRSSPSLPAPLSPTKYRVRRLRGGISMLHRRFLEMTDTELQDAISAARSLAGSESPAVLRLGDYGFEAAQRLVDPVKARRAALGAYWRGVGRRATVMLWWLHAAAVVWLCGAAADEAANYGAAQWRP